MTIVTPKAQQDRNTHVDILDNQPLATPCRKAVQHWYESRCIAHYGGSDAAGEPKDHKKHINKSITYVDETTSYHRHMSHAQLYHMLRIVIIDAPPYYCLKLQQVSHLGQQLRYLLHCCYHCFYQHPRY